MVASLAAAAAKPHSMASFLVPSRTGRSGFGQFGTNLAAKKVQKPTLDVSYY